MDRTLLTILFGVLVTLGVSADALATPPGPAATTPAPGQSVSPPTMSAIDLLNPDVVVDQKTGAHGRPDPSKWDKAYGEQPAVCGGIKPLYACEGLDHDQFLTNGAWVCHDDTNPDGTVVPGHDFEWDRMINTATHVPVGCVPSDRVAADNMQMDQDARQKRLDGTVAHLVANDKKQDERIGALEQTVNGDKDHPGLVSQISGVNTALAGKADASTVSTLSQSLATAVNSQICDEAAAGKPLPEGDKPVVGADGSVVVLDGHGSAVCSGTYSSVKDLGDIKSTLKAGTPFTAYLDLGAAYLHGGTPVAVGKDSTSEFAGLKLGFSGRAGLGGSAGFGGEWSWGGIMAEGSWGSLGGNETANVGAYAYYPYRSGEYGVDIGMKVAYVEGADNAFTANFAGATNILKGGAVGPELAGVIGSGPVRLDLRAFALVGSANQDSVIVLDDAGDTRLPNQFIWTAGLSVGAHFGGPQGPFFATAHKPTANP